MTRYAFVVFWSRRGRAPGLRTRRTCALARRTAVLRRKLWRNCALRSTRGSKRRELAACRFRNRAFGLSSRRLSKLRGVGLSVPMPKSDPVLALPLLGIDGEVAKEKLRRELVVAGLVTRLLIRLRAKQKGPALRRGPSSDLNAVRLTASAPSPEPSCLPAGWCSPGPWCGPGRSRARCRRSCCSGTSARSSARPS